MESRPKAPKKLEGSAFKNDLTKHTFSYVFYHDFACAGGAVRGEAKALFSILTLYYLIERIPAPLPKNTQSKAGSPSGGWSIVIANSMSYFDCAKECPDSRQSIISGCVSL